MSGAQYMKKKCLFGFFFLDKLHHVLIWVVWYCRRKPVFLLCSWKKPNPVKSTSFALFSFHLACSSWTNTLLLHSWSFISVLLFRSHIHTDDNFCSPVSAARETQVLLLSWGSLKHNELHTLWIKPCGSTAQDPDVILLGYQNSGRSGHCL